MNVHLYMLLSKVMLSISRSRTSLLTFEAVAMSLYHITYVVVQMACRWCLLTCIYAKDSTTVLSD